MEIIIRDERIPKNCYECSYLNYCSLNPNFKPTISKCPLKPLSQHDTEVKKQVVEELRKFLLRNSELKDDEEDSPSVIEIEILEQKLAELISPNNKGEKDE